MELFITLAVASFMITIGVPSMSNFTKNSRLKNEALDLMQTFAVARSEAIKRGTRVILCRSADPAAATPTCGGTANTWSSGWLLFASGDTNDEYNAGTDILLSINSGIPASVQIKTNAISDAYLHYNADGTLAEAGTARFTICDDRLESYGRQIDIPMVGRPFLTQGAPSSPIGDCLESA